MPRITERAQASLQMVVDKMRSGDLSPLVELARMELPEDAPALNWTFSNRMLAWIQSGGQLDCRGFNQWQVAGRHVKKRADGGVAVFILGGNSIVKEDEETGEEKIVGVTFFSIPVFPLSATEGEPIDYPGAANEPMPLEDLAVTLGIKTTNMPLAAALGATHKSGTAIVMGSGDPAVWFHKLAHAIDARLHGELTPGQHEEQETTAELTAAVLMEVYGLGDRTGNAWKYISRYAKDPLRAITRAFNKAGKILEFVFQRERARQER